MLVVTDLQGNTEPIADYKGLEIVEEINGDFSLSCMFLDTENNKYAWDLIANESIIEYEGHEYRIKQKAGETYRKQVHAPHIYFDLVDHQIYEIKGGTMYVHDAFSFALAGSGWTFEVVDNIPPQLLFNFGEDNAVSLIKKAREAFECEVKICPGKHLKIYRQIGKDEDYQFRYKHNIKAIKENVDTTKLATVIRGYGGNGLVVTYTSPNAAVFGERHADPIWEDNIIEASVMTETLKRELVDTPEVSIELQAIMLEGANLGDTVWLIHEKLGIEFQTRIMAQKRQPMTPKADTVTLGNRIATLSNLLTETKVEINENAKQFRSKIEQVNDRVTIEVEEVNASIATLELKADTIQLGVTDLGGRMGNAEAQINIQANQLQFKVSQDDYNGQRIQSLLSIDPYAMSLMAQNLNMQGLVTFSNLNSPGQAVIDGGNIYGERFIVGNGTGSTLDMYATNGSHRIRSWDAAGFRIHSNGTLSLQADNGTIYANSKFWAQNRLQVTGLSELQSVSASSLDSYTITQQGLPVATTSWVANLISALATVSYVNDQLRLKESQIVAWANNKFVAK